jgi:hypothetical protein
MQPTLQNASSVSQLEIVNPDDLPHLIAASEKSLDQYLQTRIVPTCQQATGNGSAIRAIPSCKP